MGLIADIPDARFDAIVIGRAGMDLYPDPPGTRTHEAARFVTDMGGSAGNIAVALARMGGRAGLAAPVSDDPVGEFVQTQLRRHNVTHLTPKPVAGGPRTSLALAETISDGSRTVIYRNNAADFQLKPLSESDIRSARAVVVTGTALAEEPSRSAALSALRSAHCAILDLDYRPYSWPDLATTRAVYADATAVADIIVGNDEEFEQTAADGSTGRDQATDLSKQATVIFKMGAKGACPVEGGAFGPLVAPFLIKALKPFGAGDAFLGAVLAELLEGRDLTPAMRFGSAAAALVVSRVGCASAMPTRGEVDAFIEHRERSDA